MRKHFLSLVWLLAALLVCAIASADDGEANAEANGEEAEDFVMEFEAPQEEQEEALEDFRVDPEEELEYEEERTFADFMELYGDQPVRAFEPRRGRQPQEITLKGLDEVGLIVEGPGGSEITFPLGDFDRVYQLRPDLNPAEIQRKIEEGEIAEAMDAVRKVIYPYLKFIELPEESVPTLHGAIAYLMEQQLRTNRIDEVLEIARKLPEGKLGSERYGPVYRQVIFRLIGQEREDAAVELADRFDLRPDRAAESVATVMEVADVFRLAGFYSQADRFFQRVANLRDLPEHREATLWSAYVLVAQDRREAARRALENLGDLERADRLFSLKKLVRGRMMMETGQYQDALLELSEAMVFGDLSLHWSSEILFAAAECYARLDHPDVAEELIKQLKFFFPESTWAQKPFPGETDEVEA